MKTPHKNFASMNGKTCRARIFFPMLLATGLFLGLAPRVVAADFYNLPVCRANGDQSTPLLVADGNEGAYVLWRDPRNGQPKVFCQHLNALGQPQWQADGLEVAKTTGRNDQFAAVMDGAGGVIVVWQEVAGSDKGDIYAQRMNREGERLWGENGTEVYRGSREQNFPLVGMDAAGGAFVVWQDERGGTADIFAQRLDASGNKLWQAAGLALVQDTRDQLLGDLAAPLGSGFCVTWRDERTSPARVLVQRFDANGKNLWKEPVWAASSSTDQSLPKLSLDRANPGGAAFYVAWLDRRGSATNVFAQRLDANGLLLWGNAGLAVGSGTEAQQEMQCCSDENGDLILVWEDGRNDKGDIFAQRFDRSGRRLWPSSGLALIAADQGQYRPRAASDNAGGLICTWEDDRNSGTNIAAQRVDAAGKLLWPAEGVFLTNHGGKNYTPVVLAHAQGRVLVAWQDGRRSNDDVYAQPLAAAGNFENVPPAITSLPPDSAYVNTEYNYPVTTQDFDSDASPALVLVTAPAWLQLNQSQKTLHGVPGAGDRGEVAVEIAASDAGGGRTSQNFRLQVLADAAAPAILSRPDTVAREDSPYRYVLQASDPDPQETLQYKLETTAAWLALSPQGVLSGTPLNEHVGKYAVKITVSNHKGRSDQQQFVLEVLNTNDAPRIVSAAPPRAVENLDYAFQLEATDDDANDSLIFMTTRKPAWLQVSAQGNITGAPTRNDLADTTLVVYVQDLSGARDTKTYGIAIELSNTRPMIVSTPPTAVLEDSLYRYDIVVVDPDPNEILTLSLVQGPSWLKLDAQAQVLSGIPRNANVGEHTVMLEVRDRKNARDQQRFTVRVDNTNDLPAFTSVPDTVAFVDSLYQYRVATQDVDVGDRVTLALVQAPAWLTWDAASKTLRGTPRLLDTGWHTIILQATDLLQAATTQQYALHVYNLGAPDQTAPGPAQNVTITPANWSRAASFTIRWQNPYDPSGIATAVYKMGAPPDSSHDGIAVTLSPTAPEFKFQAPREGKIPIYFWLVDGSGNGDQHSAQHIDYRFDATTPPAASNLRAGNAAAWANGDTLRFSWQPATDLLSGLARQDLIVAGKTLRRLSALSRSFALDTVLAEKKYDWQITAVDSAGNATASPPASFRVDRTPPALTHTPPDTIVAGQAFIVRALASDRPAGIAEMRVFFRTPGVASFSEARMTASGGEFVGEIAGAAVRSPGLQYVIIATDSAGNVARSTPPANPAALHAPVVASQQIFARAATRGAYYQLVSIPYRLFAAGPAAVFADNFGAYDAMHWRLYTYAAAQGNVEFGQPGFEQLEPGRAYWLITARPQAFDAGAGCALSTQRDFALELQPGWNLIATPFDFATDWRDVSRPEAVEAQLWAFEGRQYVANDSVMQPWQGYFVRNLSDQPQTLLLPPHCADCTEVLPKAAGAQNAWHVQRDDEKELALPFVWKLQLSLHCGEFADNQNWLGLAPQAAEEWDRLDWSEPPPAAGDFVQLRFPNKQWKKFAGDYTTDFRPPATAAQRWTFEILAARAGQALSLDFHLQGTLPGNYQLLLQQDDGMVREIVLDKNGDSQTWVMRSGFAPRQMFLWAGPRHELEQNGVLAAALPQAFALAPSYPNPARVQMRGQAVTTLRFSLPVQTEVDLTIWDVLGRPVRTLAQKQHLSAGHHEMLWDGRDDADHLVAAGVYICRMKTQQFSATQKIILLQ